MFFVIVQYEIEDEEDQIWGITASKVMLPNFP